MPYAFYALSNRNRPQSCPTPCGLFLFIVLSLIGGVKHVREEFLRYCLQLAAFGHDVYSNVFTACRPIPGGPAFYKFTIWLILFNVNYHYHLRSFDTTNLSLNTFPGYYSSSIPGLKNSPNSSSLDGISSGRGRATHVVFM